MPRLSKAGVSALSIARLDAYNQGSIDPIVEFESLYAGSIPRWAQQEIDRVKSNTLALQDIRSQELSGSLGLPPDIAFGDALVEVGAPASGEFRIARVYLIPDMTLGDYLAEVQAIIDDWSEKYQAETNAPRIVTEIWRIR